MSLNQSASRASGTADASDNTNAHVIMLGSYWRPSRHSRHIDDHAGGSSSGEDVMRHPHVLVCFAEALGLEIEHRVIPAALCHELVVCPELHDLAVLEHADAIGETHGGEAVRDENRGTM